MLSKRSFAITQSFAIGYKKNNNLNPTVKIDDSVIVAVSAGSMSVAAFAEFVFYALLSASSANTIAEMYNSFKNFSLSATKVSKACNVFLNKKNFNLDNFDKNFFDGFHNVFGAQVSELKQVDGINDSAIAIIKVVKESSKLMLSPTITKKPVLDSWYQEFAVFFLNNVILDQESKKFSVNFMLKDFLNKVLLLSTCFFLWHRSSKKKS